MVDGHLCRGVLRVTDDIVGIKGAVALSGLKENHAVVRIGESIFNRPVVATAPGIQYFY